MPQNCSEYTKSFDQDVILSDSAIPKVAQNGFLVEGFGVYNSIRIPEFAPNDVLVEGFGSFGATLGF